MNCLIIYYSVSGKTKLVAEKIAEILSCETEEIVDLKNRKGLIGFLVSGYDAVKKKTTNIKQITKDLASYEHIILCFPVWASNVPPSIRTFLNNFKDKIKNISFVATMGFHGAEKMFKEIESIINKKPRFTIAITKKDLKTEKYLDKIKEVIKNL
ncbi:MAG: flavodoxin family protein [Endomicrobiia bacterium]